MKQNNSEMKNGFKIDIFNLCDNLEGKMFLKKQSEHLGLLELFIGFLKIILCAFTKRYVEKIPGHHVTFGES